jgi:hypothetical protein
MIRVTMRDERGREVTRSMKPPGFFDMTPDRLQDVMKAGGQRVVDDLQDFYHLNDTHEPNYFVASGLGTRRTHFWNDVADSVVGPIVDGGTARVEIKDYRIRQKIYGGTISAKNVRFLTIPMHPDAYARRAVDVEGLFGKLFVIRMKDGRLFLAGKPDGKAVFYYRLKESVNQEPWPTAVPKRASLIDSFRSGVNKFMKSLRA